MKYLKHLSGLVLITLLLCLVSSLTLSADDQVLLSGDIDHGGFGGPVIKGTSIKGETSFFLGGCGGWLINRTFLVGGGLYSLMNDVEAPVKGADGETLYYEFGYGGLLLEYINNSHNLTHFTFSTLLGVGDVTYYDGNGHKDPKYGSDTVFVVEPGVNLELNVSPSFRIDLGASYRYVDGVKIQGTSARDLSGATVNLILKFGGF